MYVCVCALLCTSGHVAEVGCDGLMAQISFSAKRVLAKLGRDMVLHCFAGQGPVATIAASSELLHQADLLDLSV